MDYAISAAALVGLAVVIWWQVTARGHVFVIRIRNRVPFLTRGKVSQAFVTEMAEVLQTHGVRHGSIYGVRKHGSVVLAFSRGIPVSARQALRNVWSMHRR